MVAHLTARVLAGFLGLLLIQCSLTIDEVELGGEHHLDCAQTEKECNVQGVPACVGLDDPHFGCAQQTCSACNFPNATARCGLTGECVKVACHPSYEDCNEVESDGCEVALNSNVDHCGECGEACEPLPHAEVSCGSGHCYIRRCVPGFLDCNGDAADGCEVDESDPDNCGACGEACGGVCCLEGRCCEGVCQEFMCEQ